jgi:hypothetical protein
VTGFKLLHGFRIYREINFTDESLGEFHDRNQGGRAVIVREHAEGLEIQFFLYHMPKQVIKTIMKPSVKFIIPLVAAGGVLLALSPVPSRANSPSNTATGDNALGNPAPQVFSND